MFYSCNLLQFFIYLTSFYLNYSYAENAIVQLIQIGRAQLDAIAALLRFNNHHYCLTQMTHV